MRSKASAPALSSIKLRALGDAGMAEIAGERVERHQRMRRPHGDQRIAPPCERQRLVPKHGRPFDQIRPPGLHLRRRVDRQRPLLALPEIAPPRRADAGAGHRRALGFARGIIERRERSLARDLADMRMVDDDQVVARARSSTG